MPISKKGFEMNWLPVYDELCGVGTIKNEFTDFKVHENLPIELSGSGEHLYLFIEKTNANTRYVVGELAAHFQCSDREIGYAGMKDRHGVTCQWFSIYLTRAHHKDWQDINHPEFRVLEASLHNKKLKIGDLDSNSFEIIVRQFEGDFKKVEARIEMLSQSGYANYFGSQRFGNDGNTLEEAKQWLVNGERVKKSQEGLYISAIRSFLFNEILESRVKLGSWNKILLGELAWNPANDNYLLVESVDDGLTPGLVPTIQLFGRDRFQARSEAADIEKEVFVENDQLCQLLLKRKVNADRRACFTRPQGLSVKQVDATTISFSFTLEKGCYATVLLDQILLLENVAKRNHNTV
jgi:tRNA pseudouridine13 synthase